METNTVSHRGWLDRILVGSAVALTLLVMAINSMLHLEATSLEGRDPGRERDVRAQLEFLDRANDAGAPRDMQRIYPEGFFFQNVLTGLAWCDLARASRDTGLRRRAAVSARRYLQAIESGEGTRIFPRQASPRYGVFWAAWTNLLRGRILEVEGVLTDSVLRSRWEAGLEEIERAYQGTENPYQASYEGMAWSGDNVMAMLALASHDRMTGSTRFASTTRSWVSRVRATCDPISGMPPFELEHPSGMVVRSARGSSQTLLAWALTEIDTAFAREQYERMRRNFYTTRLGLPMVLEFPADSVGMADYDSGPVVWGVGASATIVTLATARRFGDTAFAGALESTIRFFGTPLRIGGNTRFALGSMPMADAWIAWARTSTPVVGIRVAPWPVGPLWRWTIHGASLAIVFAMWAMAWRIWRRKRTVRAKTSQEESAGDPLEDTP